MKNEPTSHHPFQDVATNTDIYGPTVGPFQEQTWPNRSNGPPVSERLLNSHHHDRHKYCWCSDMSLDAYLSDNNTKPAPYNQKMVWCFPVDKLNTAEQDALINGVGREVVRAAAIIPKNTDTYFTKDDILISAASETGYSLLKLYKECLFFSMEKTVHYCDRLPYSDEKEISLNL